MNKKTISAKTAATKRSTGPVATKPGQTGKPITATPAARKSVAATHFAQQNDQAPLPSLDEPWLNLHPPRIWPD